MCFVFYSHLKNLKEVYVTTALDRRAQAVRGQVGRWASPPPPPGCPGRGRAPKPLLPTTGVLLPGRGASGGARGGGGCPAEEGGRRPVDGHAAHQAAGGAGWGGGWCVQRGHGAARGAGGEPGAQGLGLTATDSSPQRLRGSEEPAQGPGLSLAPLNLGDAETGFLTQSNLLNVAGRLGPDWPAVALHLGVPYRQLQRIRHEFR